MSRLIIILSMLFGFLAINHAQEISLLTVAPGDMVYDTYGHSALRVNDTKRGSDRVYNYGLYDFNEPGFVMNFMRGRLLYQVGAHRYSDFLQSYNRDKRSIYEQKLNLNQEDKNALLQALRINMLEENKRYKYDFFFDNCSTRLRDLFENAADSLQLDAAYDPLTLRELIKEHQYGMPWSDFGIDLIIGANADRPSTLDEQMFLPLYLKDILSKAKVVVNGEAVNLLSEPYEVLSFKEEAEERLTRSTWAPKLFFPLLAIILLALRYPYRKTQHPKWLRVIDNIVLALFALLGCILAFMWLGTDHVPTKNNWNLLWCNPLFLVPLLFAKKFWVKYIIYAMLVGMLISLFNTWFQFLPQQFNSAFGWMILIGMMLLIERVKKKTSSF